MSGHGTIAALFDLDGVILDTEAQYTLLIDKLGRQYLHMEDFGSKIKGQTLAYVCQEYFPESPETQKAFTTAIEEYERHMRYDYVPGVVSFMSMLRRNGVATAIVTSSNKSKMGCVFAARPELETMTDIIVTGEMVKRSKPDPDCFLEGIKRLGSVPGRSVVFEDSFSGLKAAMASGAWVVALATTNPPDVLTPLSHMVIQDFTGLTFEDLSLAFPSLK